MQPDISIVIPAFNEAHKIAADIRAAADFFTTHNLTGQIIIADDGSTDDTASAARAADPGKENTELIIVELPTHGGKGAAVKAGITASTGKYVLFADSGRCVPYEDVLQPLEWIKAGRCQIAHASRKLPESIILRRRSLSRRITSALFRWTLITYLRLPARFTDTQCGFKLYEGRIARELYTDCRTEGFLFDVEIILRALNRGYQIEEFPITWKTDPDTRLKPTRHTTHILRELLHLKKSLHE
jgi:dolichyl-phosphate beta-glucosyltransferase